MEFKTVRDHCKKRAQRSIYWGMKISVLSRCFFWLIVAGIALTWPDQTHAQIIPSPEDPGEESDTRFSFLPVAGYSSDTGLIGGLVMQRFNYSGDHEPFLSNLKADVVASWRGDFLSELNYERTQTLGQEIRSEFSLIAESYNQANYFGIGNRTPFSDELYDQNYYYYKKRILELDYRGRKTVMNYGFDGIFDLFAGLTFSFVDASERNEESLFYQDQPTGDGDSWVSALSAGIILDDRDSEFDPREGYRYELGVETAGPHTGSRYRYARLNLELRNYAELFGSIVIAQKIEAAHRFGESPVWRQPMLGSKYGLRGYHLDRFLGDSSLLHVLEARTWLFSIFDGEIKFGGQLFWDSGRVFSENDSNRIFDNWKQTFGFGGAISLFNPDFIFRGEMGFSEESVRIYAGVGYMF